jgi:hypothetical protein
MTVAARKVLHDACYAIHQHQDTLQGEAFRVSLFAVVGLLRAVGHVLDKVDSEISPAMKRAIKDKFSKLKSQKTNSAIYWEFIHEERNSLLKNYKSSVIRTFDLYDIWGNFLTTENVGENSGVEYVGANTKSIIARGHFVNKSEQEVAWQAHDWWVAYLDEIDELARKYENVQP